MKEVLQKNDERMQRRIDHLVDEFKGIRAGRANQSRCSGQSVRRLLRRTHSDQPVIIYSGH